MLKNKWLWLTMIVILFVIAACSNDVETTVYKKNNEKTAVPAFNPPSMDDLDPDDPMTAYIQYGEKVFSETNVVLDDQVGSELSCMSCHADGGLSKNTTLVGVRTQYPQYVPREGIVSTLEDRINSCVVRSMNGEKLPHDSKEMRSIVAYLTYISEGIKTGADIPWGEKNTMEKIPEPSVENGEELYEKKNCLSCHATDGSGTGANSGPPLWGDKSFSDGASLSRIGKMAGYIKNNMPPNNNGALTKQEAADLAAFILSQDRPTWEEHDTDWPNGDRPTDIITQDQRKKIQKDTFDWTKIDSIIPSK
ncbi:c-type cytochrome [Virgibacillus sp. FSP13]